MTTGKSTWTVYQPQVIEPKWQSAWEQAGIYTSREDITRQKYYCLDYFPYPSGEGLHVGHCRNYVPTDVISRFKRMQGLNVLHPMGWDAFGEPTEQYAISHNIHPRLVTDQNTSNFRSQLRLIGTSYDWSREIDSSQPEYYRWTQYIFTLLFKRGLAYRDESWQWWCPTCMTTLSSHEVSGGVCWRGHSGVVRREIPAWYFRITAYADELLSGLDEIDWPDPIKTSQRNWIGRSEGWEIDFLGEDLTRLSVFTTRLDTLFGVTFLALAPEHELVEKLTQSEYLERVRSYRELALSQSEIERMDEKRAKTGVFTGSYLRNPINDEPIPVWIADYVLPGYGTGAVMGVPAHDQRDYEFARQFQLPVRRVISASGGAEPLELSEAYTDYGCVINSGQFTGMDSSRAGEVIGDILNTQGTSRRTVRYRMRDWLISRQRYWGTPIPVVYCDSCGAVPVPPEQLPVLLPPIDDFQPDGTGRSPLARTEEFIRTTCPICDEPARRESDTMGGFACSSWYFLRFASPHEGSAPFNTSAVEYWLPVDLYVGGAEHAVLHLLYARFWTKFLADEGLIHFREPFLHLRNQGQLLAADGQRMSKSRGNVITPDSVVATYGADALRLYVMFIAPFDQDVSWNTDGINGARRFLNRIWALFAEAYSASSDCRALDAELERSLHRTIRAVTERIADFRLNTMISALMEFTNQLYDLYQAGNWQTASYHQALDALLLLLAPAAPYIAEELWLRTGKPGSVHLQPWPVWDEGKVSEEIIELPVQVNGKFRLTIQVAREMSQEQVTAQALAQPRLADLLAGCQVQQVIYVPGKIINIVCG